MSRVRERAVAFGHERAMVGVVTSPSAPPPSDRPVVVVLNAGVIHRVGANRLNVRLARTLARAGFVVFRFDLSGIGDSEPRRDALELDAAVRLDLEEALDYLAKHRNAHSFILVGLCSGADNAFKYAVRDSRVERVVLIDPVAFRTPGYYAHYYGKRLLRPTVWLNVLRGRNPTVRWLVSTMIGRAGPENNVPENAFPPGPTRQEMQRGLRRLTGRQTDMLVIFTAGLEERYAYARQFQHTFPREVASGRIRVEYFADADHTFSDECHKDRLMELTRTWLLASVPMGRPGEDVNEQGGTGFRCPAEAASGG